MKEKYITDFHTHILPEMDDGSRSMETTLRMLEAELSQGVQCVIATPHFYGWKHSIGGFLARRQSCMDRLREETKGLHTPEIIAGSEVTYFPGISKAKELDKLAIEGTNIILMEMPFEEWSDSCISEIMEMQNDRQQIILAHIERYMSSRRNIKALDKMRDKGILMQVNTECLDQGSLGRKVLKMIGRGEVHLLGSDCHGMNHRPPNMEAGREIIGRKLGQEALDNIDRKAAELIRGENR